MCDIIKLTHLHQFRVCTPTFFNKWALVENDVSCHSPIMATHEGNVASAKICLEVGNKLLAGQEDLSRSTKTRPISKEDVSDFTTCQNRTIDENSNMNSYHKEMIL